MTNTKQTAEPQETPARFEPHCANAETCQHKDQRCSTLQKLIPKMWTREMTEADWAMLEELVNVRGWETNDCYAPA